MQPGSRARPELPWRFARLLSLVALVLTAFASRAPALPQYRVTPLGLTDGEHTRNDGRQFSTANRLTESGFVEGESRRYDGGSTVLGQSIWIFDPHDRTVTRTGLFDAEHTRSDGYQSNSSEFFTESGFAAGSTERYGGGATDLGTSAWLYDPGSHGTTRLGFFDAAYTRSDGSQTTTLKGLNQQGYAVGYSHREDGQVLTSWIYDPTDGTVVPIGLSDADHTRSDGHQWALVQGVTESNYAVGYSGRYGGGGGESAWLYDVRDRSTTRLGLFDAMHTRNDGYQSSRAMSGPTGQEIPAVDTGYVVGTSSRFGGGATGLGTSVWLYDDHDGSTVTLGLLDAEHTTDAGYHVSSATKLTASGFVTGASQRFVDLSYRGSSAWIYDPRDDSVTRLGYTDANHTRSDELQDSVVSGVTESGYAIGSSQRYGVGSSEVGVTSWIYDSASRTTTRIGLFDTAHTRADGHQSSTAETQTESGFVIGSSFYYDGGATRLGYSAWVYDAGRGTTTRLGLFDEEHVRSDGSQDHRAHRVSESGFVIGGSDHYIGADYRGLSTWLYDPRDGGITRLGLLDADHTDEATGRVYSVSQFLTDSGYVAGFSSRYVNPGSVDGYTAWVYDANSRTLDSIVLSVRSDGYAYSDVSFLGEDGLALGLYTLFDENDVDRGSRAFAWTPEDGAVDLGALVAGGLRSEGWSYLAEAIRANGLGTIVGWGRRRSNGSQLAFLLEPVPEPGTILLCVVGLAGLAARRRRLR